MRFYDRYLKGIKPSVSDPAFAIEDSTGAWRAQPTWPTPTSSTSARLPDGQYVDDGVASTLAAPARWPTSSGTWSTRTDPAAAAPRRRLAPTLAAADAQQLLQLVHADHVPGADHRHAAGHAATPSATGQRHGAAVGRRSGRDGGDVRRERRALIERAGRVAFDLKSTDWTFEVGHQLGVQIGTIGSGGWRDTPSGNTITVTRARLGLALQDPRFDVPTQGDRSPFLDTYLRQYTRTLTDVGEGTFPLAVRGRH